MVCKQAHKFESFVQQQGMNDKMKWGKGFEPLWMQIHHFINIVLLIIFNLLLINILNFFLNYSLFKQYMLPL
jgi:hypothetical protein